MTQPENPVRPLKHIAKLIASFVFRCNVILTYDKPDFINSYFSTGCGYYVKEYYNWWKSEFPFKKEWYNGIVEWFDEEGNHHRVNGPAVEYPTGYQEWYKNGSLHRETGPAIIDSDKVEYWLNDRCVGKQEYESIRKEKLKVSRKHCYRGINPRLSRPYISRIEYEDYDGRVVL